MDLVKAVEVFSQGFAFTRSFTHPYIVERTHGITIMRDGPGKKWDPRNPEYIVLGMSVEEGVDALRAAGCVSGGICVVDPPTADLDSIKEAYKRFGTRLMRREPFFSLEVSKAVRYDSPVEIVRVNDDETAAVVNKANRRRQLLPEHLGREDTIRVYAAFDGGAPVGWVSSIPVGTNNWVSNLFVAMEQRGRGIGRALMSHMLADDERHGAHHSVLLASGDGSRLYPHLGYERIGTLQLFVPTNDWRTAIRR